MLIESIRNMGWTTNDVELDVLVFVCLFVYLYL